MAKTRRDLLLAIAKKVGGERGRRMRQAIREAETSGMMDRLISDAEYARQLENAERDLPGVLAKLETVLESPGTWGFPN
ncbi:hypothetical protein [Opitutus sp. ER46]|uniref:hypothetical protein n=1 Tax=Opitutus sp. ER46 TaxID=2161864 RepID=UPI000D324D5B|nr:hypothetical protein [Opitutus sp. ER46]PTX91062.1 hypothetical protein DB354_20705 [Opitutus sp. ER46]